MSPKVEFFNTYTLTEKAEILLKEKAKKHFISFLYSPISWKEPITRDLKRKIKRKYYFLSSVLVS
jgi:hypothetical protein